LSFYQIYKIAAIMFFFYALKRISTTTKAAPESNSEALPLLVHPKPQSTRL